MLEPLVLGIPLAALLPGVVEAMKRGGMPERWAGLAAIVAGIALAALADLAGIASATSPGGGPPAAGWVLAGVVYGLAASGLYSQARAIRQR